MKLIYSIFMLFVISNAVSQSPIVLSNSQMPSSGDTLRYSQALQNSIGDYTTTGTNMNWNFSSLVPISQGVRSYKSAFQTPYFIFFLGFNEYGEKVADTLGAGPIQLTNYYLYYKKQNTPVNAYIADGAGITFSGVPVPNYYTDKDELYHFPLTYPKYDSTTFKFASAGNTLIPVQYSKTGYRVTKVDGWGNITTPFGTEACLRIVTTQYSKDSIKNNLLPFPLGFNNYQRSYQWLTMNSKIPFLEVNGNLVGNNFTITQIRYRDIPRLITGNEDLGMLEQTGTVYPNPVGNNLFLGGLSNGLYTVEILDLSGKLLRNSEIEINPKGNPFYLELNNLKSGVYYIRLSKETNSQTFKIIKE
ncbi:MAG: T9SS type A sorting domain-containing protein [Sphingobacteriaceae bacterium]|nr:T9SS type A sorting domain-containing protein [Sphingobacteriaceae bacterium]